MTRVEAMQMVVDRGGLISNSLNKSTNYLVVGSFDYVSSVKNGKSTKLKKAEELKLKGHDIEIVSENVFFEMMNE